jgi:hypothetical protein
MNELCFLTGLTSSEWAAWVQAIGSILAIVAAWWIGHRQLRHAARTLEQAERANTEAVSSALYLICEQAVELVAEVERFPDTHGLSVDTERADRMFAQLTALISPVAPPRAVWLLVRAQSQVSRLQTLLKQSAGRSKLNNSGVYETLKSIREELDAIRSSADDAARHVGTKPPPVPQ